MKHTIGNFLIVLSIICAAVTVFWFGSGLADMPKNLSEDNRTTLYAMSFFFVVLLALEAATFFYGRYLRRHYPTKISKQIKTRRKKHRLLFIVYIGCSIAITVFIFLPKKGLFEIKALFFVIGQGWVLAQLIFGSLGGIIGFKLGGGIITHVIMIAFNLLYYLALFYPVFRIVTMDRKQEAVRYKLMKTLLIIFFSVHILMIFVMTMLVRA
jgi:hypothetical protein